MSADSADEYVNKLQSFGDVLDMHVDVKHVVGDGDVVAALVDFNDKRARLPTQNGLSFETGRLPHYKLFMIHGPFWRVPRVGSWLLPIWAF